MGNTVGSRIQDVDWAYIAGFFDGDGSLMVQIKNRRDTTTGWRLMFTICLYQDTHHKEPLQWMRKKLGIGHLHDRKDGITEYRINGYSTIKSILEQLQPYVRFKERQVTFALRILRIIEGKSFPSIPRRQRAQVADLMIKLREANYSAHQHQRSAEEIHSLLEF